MELTPENLRARFAELQSERIVRLEVLDAVRKDRDELVAETQPKEREFAEQIKLLSNDLAPIDNEMAMIARALNGKTGEPAPAEEAPAS